MSALKLVVSLWSLVFSLFIFAQPVLAQNKAIDIVDTFTLADTKAVDGDIIFNTDKGLVLSSEAYSNKIFGVLQKTPLLVYRSDPGKLPISRSGVTEVNVTDFNGAIKPGDFITSSDIPGKGQKASISGYVLGTVIGDVTGIDKITYLGKQYTSGKAKVALRIEFAELTSARNVNRLIDALNFALFRNLQTPEKFAQLLKYILAGLVILLAFLIGAITFSRSIPKSIEAIGRNPLAKRSIRTSVLMNVIFTVIVTTIGVAAAFLILRL